jgi:hypothetical protein
MQPTLSDVHVNQLLTMLSNMYEQEADAFVAAKVFPIVPVTKQSDRYLTYSRADFNRNLMRKRAPSTESAGGGYTVDNTKTYSCDVWSLHKDIDDQIRANADAIMNLDLEATRYLVNQSLISREIDWATNFFTGSIWTNNWAGVASGPTTNQFLKWSDPNSNPIIDIRNAKRTVQLTGTYRPNKMVLGRPVFDVLCDHPDFIDRIKYGQTPGKPAKVTLDAMAGLFELDEVVVMDSIINTGVDVAGADSGGTFNAGESNAFIGGSTSVAGPYSNFSTDGKGVLLCYTPSSPGIMTPGCGYTFAWTGYFGAAPNGTRIKSFYMQHIESQRVEIDAAFNHKLVSGDLGLFLSSPL